MFAQLQIERSTGQVITVPIVVGQKEKYYYRSTQDPNLTKPIEKALPIMSLEFNGLKYDAQRKQQSTKYIKSQTSEGMVKQNMGVPYDLNFTLSIFVRTIEDGMQIIEQILPIFTPDYTLKIEIDPTIGFTKEFPVWIDDITYEVLNINSPDAFRYVTWELNFTVQGWYLPPITDPSIIKTAITNIVATTQTSMPLIFLKLTPTGNTSFAVAETVYQGNSLGQATATGTVQNWDSKNDMLYIFGISGTFDVGSNVIGVSTYTTGNVANIVFNTVPSANIVLTINPPTANVNSNWAVNTAINEFFTT